VRIKTAETMQPGRDKIMLFKSYLPKGACSESPCGHEWTLIAPRERSVTCADATVCCQVEERIFVTMVVALPARPALVRLVAGIFGGGPGPNVNFDDAIEEFTR